MERIQEKRRGKEAMKRVIEDLKELAQDLRQGSRRMASEVREGYEQGNKGLERMVQAVHAMGLQVGAGSKRLSDIAQCLKEQDRSGYWTKKEICKKEI